MRRWWCRLFHFEAWIDETTGRRPVHVAAVAAVVQVAAHTVLRCQVCRLRHTVPILWAR